MTAKVRPCLVISTRIGDDDRALLCLVPHTTSTRQTLFEAVVNPPFLNRAHSMRKVSLPYPCGTQSVTSDHSTNSSYA
ncbi:MAG: hypothetical protein ABI779_22835 [Acidobacteriota bacterium]